MSLLVQRYAKAVFEVAEAAGTTEQVGRDLETLARELDQSEIGLVVASPETATRTRKALLDQLLPQASKTTKSLVDVILRRRRQAILPKLSAAFDVLRRQARGEVLGLLETAKPIGEPGFMALSQQASQLCGKKVTLEVILRPELIGGVRIRVGNTLYDGSVATALEELERQLMNVPIP